ncbi:hypothetical protein PUN28_007455 [Cardiocondyla obscurior]|uniref:Uncharacterized protein n=1 Tax=Cardiocondyla obscurior TaxID=286306 RepID=A0AAW2G5A8_9HYME
MSGYFCFGPAYKETGVGQKMTEMERSIDKITVHKYIRIANIYISTYENDPKRNEIYFNYKSSLTYNADPARKNRVQPYNRAFLPLHFYS